MSAGDLCPQCGQVHSRCTSHKKKARGGGPCNRHPLPGATVCYIHGGEARQVKAKAEQRLQDEHARQAVATYGLPLEIEPHQALLDEVYRTHGHVIWLRDTIQALQAEQLHGPVGGGEHSEPRHEPHVWIRLYQEERRHLARVAFDCIKAGIEERRIKLAEQDAERIVAYTKGLLGELGINPGSEKARVAVRKHLTLIAGGQS